jgi:glucokinase
MKENEYLLGFDIGGTKCAAVLGFIDENHQMKVIDKFKYSTREFISPGDCIAHFIKCSKNVLQNRRIGIEQLAGIGISCGGPLDSRRGLILSPPNLPGWDNIPVIAQIREAFDLPIYLQNDANACAVAEWKFGAGAGTENMIFLTFGTGLGAGMILNGRLYAGASDMAGEVGHIRLKEFGPVGYGKSGSFEGFCSGGGIAQLARIRALEALQSGRKPGWCPTLSDLDSITAQAVGEAAAQGDELAIRIYAECGEYLGRGLSTIIDILNPEIIVLGSIFVRCEKLLRPAMEEAIARESLCLSAERCRIVPAGLGESIGDIACLTLASGKF